MLWPGFCFVAGHINAEPDHYCLEDSTNNGYREILQLHNKNLSGSLFTSAWYLLDFQSPPLRNCIRLIILSSLSSLWEYNGVEVKVAPVATRALPSRMDHGSVPFSVLIFALIGVRSYLNGLLFSNITSLVIILR
jgi:hypothetical protein